MSHALVRCNYRCNGGFQHHRFDHCSSSPFSMILLSTCYILPSRGKKYPGNRLVIKKKENPGLKPRHFGIRIFSFGRHYCDHCYYYCFRKKDIEILKICILFLNIVSLPLSLFRVEMDIPLWIVLASFLHRSINSRERYAYDDEV